MGVDLGGPGVGVAEELLDRAERGAFAGEAGGEGVAFTFGSQKHPRYSDNAYRKMKAELEEGIDMEEVWRSHGPRPRPPSAPRG